MVQERKILVKWCDFEARGIDTDRYGILELEENIFDFMGVLYVENPYDYF